MRFGSGDDLRSKSNSNKPNFEGPGLESGNNMADGDV